MMEDDEAGCFGCCAIIIVSIVTIIIAVALIGILFRVWHWSFL